MRHIYVHHLQGTGHRAHLPSPVSLLDLLLPGSNNTRRALTTNRLEAGSSGKWQLLEATRKQVNVLTVPGAGADSERHARLHCGVGEELGVVARGVASGRSCRHVLALAPLRGGWLRLALGLRLAARLRRALRLGLKPKRNAMRGGNSNTENAIRTVWGHQIQKSRAKAA